MKLALYLKWVPTRFLDCDSLLYSTANMSSNSCAIFLRLLCLGKKSNLSFETCPQFKVGSHTLPSLRLPVVLCRLELPRIQSPSTHNHAIAPLQQVADSYFHYFSGYSGKSLNTYFHNIHSPSRSFSLSFWGQKINSLLFDGMFTITLKTNS